jgi:hypothetical protein
MWGLFSAGSWLSQYSSAGVARGAFFFSVRLQGGALGGPGPAWVQLGPPLARGAPAGELTAASSTTGDDLGLINEERHSRK